VTAGVGRAEQEIVRAIYRLNGVNAGRNKPDATFFGIFVIPIKIFSLGTHVHVEYRTGERRVTMVFGHHRLFDGVHTTNRGTVSIVAAIDFPGSHTLQPGNFFRMLSNRLFPAHT